MTDKRRNGCKKNRNCRNLDEGEPARGVEALSHGSAKSVDETRQVGERLAQPTGNYVQPDPVDGRLHPHSAALQVSAALYVKI